jgi:hypothetical protein
MPAPHRYRFASCPPSPAEPPPTFITPSGNILPHGFAGEFGVRFAF